MKCSWSLFVTTKRTCIILYAWFLDDCSSAFNLVFTILSTLPESKSSSLVGNFPSNTIIISHYTSLPLSLYATKTIPFKFPAPEPKKKQAYCNFHQTPTPPTHQLSINTHPQPQLINTIPNSQTTFTQPPTYSINILYILAWALRYIPNAVRLSADRRCILHFLS